MNRFSHKKVFRPALLFFTFLFLTSAHLSGCGNASPENSQIKDSDSSKPASDKQGSNKQVSKTSFFLSTVVTITLCGTEDDSLIEECFSLCDKYEKTLSRTLEGSEIYALNHRTASTVSEETLSLIEIGLKYSALSDGALDIAIGSCSSLWDFTAETPSLPDKAALSEALAHVGYEKLSLNGNTVSFSDDQTLIDLGAIAKGYIADRLKDFLVENGVTSAIIDLGGNVLCIGDKPDGSPFRIGIQKPFDPQGTPMLVVPVSDRSVVTSGIYERYFEEDGKLYHHILDPATGYPCENNLLSVTILSEHSVDGDALSTACFSLGLEEGTDLIDSLDEIYAIFITDDYEVHYSEGLLEQFAVSEP